MLKVSFMVRLQLYFVIKSASKVLVTVIRRNYDTETTY